MLEKSSTIVFTEDEARSVERGILPDRLEREWGLTIQEAKVILEGLKRSSTDAGPKSQN